MMMKLALLGLTVISLSACGARVVRIPSDEALRAMAGAALEENAGEALQSPLDETSKSTSKATSSNDSRESQATPEAEAPATESKKSSESVIADESSEGELPELLPDPSVDSEKEEELLPLPVDVAAGGTPEASVYDLDEVVVVESPNEVQSGPASVVIDAPHGSRTQYSLDRDFPVEGGLSLEWTSLSNGHHELEITVMLPDGQTKDFNFEWRQESGAAAQAKKRRRGPPAGHVDQGRHLGTTKR